MKDPWTDKARVTNYTIYISCPAEIGEILELMSEQGAGEVIVKIVNDDAGDTAYCMTGYVDDIYIVRVVHEKCVQRNLKAMFTY